MIRSRTAVLLLLASSVVLAQNQPAPGGWRRVTDPPPTPVDQASPSAPADAFGQPIGQPPAPQDRAPLPPAAVPPELGGQPGTFVTLRIDQPLHSDHNQPGDSFTATLAQPLVVDGVVVAQRGQTVFGRVAEAEKARSSHPSRLGLELTGL